MLRACLTDGCVSTEVDSFEPQSLLDRLRQWMADEGPWWGCSFVVHLLLFCAIAAMGFREMPDVGKAEYLTAVKSDDEPEEPEIAPLNIMRPDVADSEGPPRQFEPDTRPLGAVALVDSERVESLLGLSGRDGGDGRGAEGVPGSRGEPGFVGRGLDPKLAGTRIPGSFGSVVGKGPGFGIGGVGNGASRVPRPGDDHTRATVSRAAAALNWIARHQLEDGSWSLQRYVTRCKDGTCTGPGTAVADSAATAMGLLPFLAGGQTHVSKCPYKKQVAGAVAWLMRCQKPDGDLRCGSTMYAHGLATIALCEAYGMSGDRAVGYAAQRAVDFIQAAQNRSTGGWRYKPGDDGDLSVVGWQVMALKSAQMAGLHVDPRALERAKAYLATVSSSRSQGSGTGGRFSYIAGGSPTATMTSVGLLCCQYLGARRDDPAMAEGTAELLRNLPDRASRDLYYWYYATQVMHNQPGSDWDTWNRKMRKILIETQDREGCSAGSWDPQKPSPDRWGAQGGRLMMTSLAALTLEVYYRYLPLYKLDRDAAGEKNVR